MPVGPSKRRRSRYGWLCATDLLVAVNNPFLSRIHHRRARAEAPTNTDYVGTTPRIRSHFCVLYGRKRVEPVVEVVCSFSGHLSKAAAASEPLEKMPAFACFVVAWPSCLVNVVSHPSIRRDMKDANPFFACASP